MFTPKTIAFLRALKRHNDRDWFKARKDDYERHVREPMIALLGQLEEDFASFAPEMVAHPKVSLFRIYRDTRFSADKSPLKTHVAAHFPDREVMKRGAGLYVQIGPREVMMGGGIYMPEPSDLVLIREHVSTAHRRLTSIVSGRAFRNAVGELRGDQLTRVPRAFRTDHPAADLLRRTQFLGVAQKPAEFAYDPTFYRGLLDVFKAVTPLVRFLNEPLRAPAARPIARPRPTR